MSQNKMDELSVYQLLNKYNFVIPEIQREYVWGSNEVIELFMSDIEKSFQDYKKKNIRITAEGKDITDLIDAVNQKTTEYYMNIGFLYSYTPHYSNGNKQYDDVHLIDGQQRFTTIFLLLFYLSLKSSKSQNFVDLLRFDYAAEKNAFDYRVRNITHDFIMNIVQRCSEVDEINTITSKTWFLSDYKNDVTVKNIIEAFKKINDKFKGYDDAAELYQYILNNIRFWHFKTEATSQGEELYITMNSRGEQLADNENIKATLFEKAVGDKKSWGVKWESWQDFFWKHKSDNDENADRGFDAFLNWVSEIEAGTPGKASELSLEVVESYFNALEWLIDNNNDVCNIASGIAIPDFSGYLKENLNDKKKVSIYPVLIYIHNNFNKIKPDRELFRIIRFFYNVSHFSSALSSVVTLAKKCLTENSTVLSLLHGEVNDNFKNILTDEEVLKLKYYKQCNDEASRKESEKVFWAAEDYPLNKGEIYHLIHYTFDNSLTDYKEGACLSETGKIEVTDFIGIFKNYQRFTDSIKPIYLLSYGDIFTDNGRRIQIRSHYNFYKDYMMFFKIFNESDEAKKASFIEDIEHRILSKNPDDLSNKEELLLIYIQQKVEKAWINKNAKEKFFYITHNTDPLYQYINIKNNLFYYSPSNFDKWWLNRKI